MERTLYRENPREWYSALMDYGTVLKKRTANPNRRSASYSRQSRFEGSDRQIRGANPRARPRRRDGHGEGGDPPALRRARAGEEDPRRPRTGGIRRRERGRVYLPVRLKSGGRHP
ncbi:hypothetical protein [Methanoculleus chikugoensis]|uniref:hypothetical protein n=1 Tax=Methanoculleus chikugoensis TaxID=118126 RepID=UPI000AF20806|nr:hypothetical protein [Methanoculleus chikugoensis]